MCATDPVACCCVDDVLVYAMLEVFLDVLMSDVFPVVFSRDCSVFLDDFSIVFIVVNNSERKLGCALSRNVIFNNIILSSGKQNRRYS